MPGGGEACEMFEEKTAFAAPAEREFADELLVSGALIWGSLDVAEKLPIGHRAMVAGWRGSKLASAGEASGQRRRRCGKAVRNHLADYHLGRFCP